MKKVYGGSKETEKHSFFSKEVLNVCWSIMTAFRENGPGVTNHCFCWVFLCQVGQQGDIPILPSVLVIIFVLHTLYRYLSSQSIIVPAAKEKF